jgi:hypothetical protein
MEGHIVGMGNGGKKLKYTPPTEGRVYSDNTRVAPSNSKSLPTPQPSITELLKDKTYQLPKYTPKTEIPRGVKKVLNSLDIATDVLQLGHFSPDPYMIGQTAGLIGDNLGKLVDLAQSGIDTYEGNYGNAALNLGLSALPGQTKKLGYERPSSLLTGKGSGMYRPLTATTPTLAQNPVIKKGLNWNRGTLAANLTELGSNTGLPDTPSTNAQTQKEYQDNLKTAPLLKNPEMKYGGMADKTITCSNCGWSWKASEGGLNPLSCHKCGGVAKMQRGGKVDHSNDDDMVNGVASILRRVKDKKNRLQLANQLSSQFNREKVKYSLNDFLNKSKVKK